MHNDDFGGACCKRWAFLLKHLFYSKRSFFNQTILSAENDAKAVDAGDQSPAAESATSTVPTGQSAPTSQEDEIIGFAAYQKEQRMRRALLQQTQIVVSSARNIDASELEKEGYQRYEREETEEERAARERRMQKLHRNNDRDGSNDSDVERNLQRKDIKVKLC